MRRWKTPSLLILLFVYLSAALVIAIDQAWSNNNKSGRISRSSRDWDRHDKNAPKSKRNAQFWPEIISCESSFSPGIFNFLATEPTFGREEHNFNIGWLGTMLGHIQACPTRFLAQKTFVVLKRNGHTLFWRVPFRVPSAQHPQHWMVTLKKSVVAAGLRSLCILVFNHLGADMADSLASVPAAPATPTAGAGA